MFSPNFLAQRGYSVTCRYFFLFRNKPLYQSTRWVNQLKEKIGTSHLTSCQVNRNATTIINSIAKPSQHINNQRNDSQCSVCHREFTTHVHPLSFKFKKKLSNGSLVCAGCKALLGKDTHDSETVSFIKSFFSSKNKDNGNTSSVPVLDKETGQAIQRLVKKVRRNMITRCRICHYFKFSDRKVCDSYCKSIIPSKRNLIDIAVKSKKICSISGIQGSWDSKECYWRRLTFDHIVPISKGGTFSADNIQVVLGCINQLKGDHDNTELLRFLSIFKRKINTIPSSPY